MPSHDLDSWVEASLSGLGYPFLMSPVSLVFLVAGASNPESQQKRKRENDRQQVDLAQGNEQNNRAENEGPTSTSIECHDFLRRRAFFHCFKLAVALAFVALKAKACRAQADE